MKGRSCGHADLAMQSHRGSVYTVPESCPCVQDTVKSNASKTGEILTWQHSSIFQTAKTKATPPAQKQVRYWPRSV